MKNRQNWKDNTALFHVTVKGVNFPPKSRSPDQKSKGVFCAKRITIRTKRPFFISMLRFPPEDTCLDIKRVFIFHTLKCLKWRFFSFIIKTIRITRKYSCIRNKLYSFEDLKLTLRNKTHNLLVFVDHQARSNVHNLTSNLSFSTK